MWLLSLVRDEAEIESDFLFRTLPFRLFSGWQSVIPDILTATYMEMPATHTV